MKPVQSFIKGSAIRILTLTEDKISKSGVLPCPKNYTPGKAGVKRIGTNVKIVKETEDSTFIAKFNPDGTYSDEDFVILATTDLHFEDDVTLRDKTYSMLAKNIEEIRPDFILFTGDVIQSNYQQIDAVRFARMMEEFGIYWAYVFGNHEAREPEEYYKYFLLENLSRYEHCLSKVGPKELFGFGNFFVNIMDGENSLRQSLVFLDSGRNITPKFRFEAGVPSNVEGYDYIKPSQMKWYAENIRALEALYGESKSLMFMHIPLKEYENVFQLNDNGDYVPTGKAELIYGSMYESIGSSPVNTGMFSLIKKLGSTQAVFCGHDHVNDFYAIYQGVGLVYLQCGGYETYTMGDMRNWDEKDWQQGVTKITLDKNKAYHLEQKLNSRFM